jgi:hypothetical protein
MAGPATTVIAIYGALVATVSIGWNIFTHIQKRVNLKIDGTVGQFTPTTPDPGTNRATGVCFTVRNLSPFPVVVKEVGFGNHGSGQMAVFPPEGLYESVSTTISPKDKAEFHFRSAFAPPATGVDVNTYLYQGTPFVVRLADGQKIWSDRYQLLNQTTFERVKGRRK